MMAPQDLRIETWPLRLSETLHAIVALPYGRASDTGLGVLNYFTRTNGMSRIRDAPTCMPLIFPFLSRVNQTTYPCRSKWSLYSGCIGRLVAGRCLRNALSPSTTRLRDAPASSLNQSPLNDASSSGVGVHACSGTKRLTSLSESAVSAQIGLPA